MKRLTTVLWLCLAQCTVQANPGDDPTISPQQVAYYRRVLPQAHHFAKKPIPAVMLLPVDQGSASYLEVYNRRNELIGYLRDYTGPVSPAAECACNPLNLTLVFGPDKQFRTLLSAAPLQKYGHAPMTDEEQSSLINIVRAPPDVLLSVRRVEDMVDATTGATKAHLAPYVVPHAALSTRRIAGLVRDTAAILRGAPASRDRERLHAILNSNQLPLQQARELAALLPELEAPELRPQAYQVLANAYVTSLTSEPSVASSGDATIEAALLKPNLPADSLGETVARTCYRVADKSLRLNFVRACINALESRKATAPPLEWLRLLRGTERFMSGDEVGALGFLQEAARRFDIHGWPNLHLRLSRALAASQQTAPACAVARQLYAEHPLLPGIDDALSACTADPNGLMSVKTQLQENARTALLRQVRATGPAAPAMSVESETGQMADIPLFEAGKVTVVVFFATWCPHCRAELPRVKDFVSDLAQQKPLKDKVRVLGIRTAVEKETEPYESFRQQFKLNFPVYYDATMSLAFSHFAKTAGVPVALPTTAVINEHGIIKFLIEPGDWRDTRTELTWAVKSLL